VSMRSSTPLCALLFVALLCAGLSLSAAAADLVLYGDDAGSSFSQLDHIVADAAAARRGSEGLRVEPTYWHNQFMRIATGRTDFRRYTHMSFWIRAAAAGEDNRPEPELVVWDYAAGTPRRVADYVTGGVIDDQWRQAVIPVADLASEAFELDSVFLIGFRPSQHPRAFFIDDIQLDDASLAVLKGWSMPSDRAVTLIFDRLDLARLGDGARFVLSGGPDTGGAEGIAPIRIGAERVAVRISDGGTAVESETRLHLLFAEPLLAARDYRLSYQVVAPSGRVTDDTVTVRFDPDAVSSSIKVNQVGYQPRATKVALIGNWLGDQGAMPIDATGFEVIDTATDTVVLSGALVLRAEDDPQSGEHVYQADFSLLTAPGTYQLAVPGLGRSYPFEIADDVYDDVYRTTMRVLYHKRNTRLTAPYAKPGFEREGIDPLWDAALHPILATYPLSRGELPYDFRPVTGGWYDAGDYGQYVHNAAPVWAAIGLAMDLAAPGHFTDGELSIPESGNGVPDILDELRWGMRWALSMQDDDGGVYWRVCSGSWDLGMPEDVSEPRFIYEKTTRATAQLAAMGAIYNRLLAPYDPADADAALAAAERAWQYASTRPFYPPEGELYRNPSEHPGGGTYAVRSARPDLLWATAELYRTTGELRYQDAYRHLLEQVSVDMDAAPTSTWAFWALVQAHHPGRDVLLLESARRTLMVAADRKLERIDAHPYRSAKHPHIPFTGWYNFAVSPIQSLALLQAHNLTGDAVYLDYATQLLDIILGANPQSQVYLTGIGEQPVRDPMDRISLNDANDEPLPGLTVAGPTWHLSAYREPYISTNAAYWPPEQPAAAGDYHGAYPVLRRWIDQHDLIDMSESTVREWAAVAAAFGLLRNAASPVVASERPYAWTARQERSTTIYRLDDIPVADVPQLTPEQITGFGAGVGIASDAHLAALTPAQVAAIAAPDEPYWVARLSLTQQLALTPAQIAAFAQWSLFTALPPRQVPLIPPEKMPLLGVEVRNTTGDWKAAITAEQRAAMTGQQQAIMAQAGY